LNHIASYVPASLGIDNSVAINSALNDPATAGVILAPGDIRVDHAIVVPTGKFLRGAGKGATRLIRTDNINASSYLDKALVRSAQGSRGVRVSDLTLVSPKVADKVNGVWMVDTTDFRVDRVETLNCGYALWAQNSSRGVFAQCDSYNANVHYETTQAYDVLFEDGVSSDGDGDNPLGVEAVWHTLLASRDVTFRNMRHRGKGIPFLVVANDINGDPLGGLIDNIRFIGCRAVAGENKFGLHVSRFNGQVGRIYLDDCHVDQASVAAARGGIPGLIETGDVSMSRCSWRSATGGTLIEAYPGARLLAVNNDMTADGGAGNFGSFYSSDNGAARILGGRHTVISGSMRPVSGPCYVSPQTDFVGLRSIDTVAIGRFGRVVLAADSTNQDYIGQNTPTAMLCTIQANGVYRARACGLLRINSASVLFAIYSGGAAHRGVSGTVRVDTSDDGSTPPKSVAITVVAGGGATGSTVSVAASSPPTGWRYAEADVMFTGGTSGGDVRIACPGATAKAGFELIVERLA
jgi:hypothetical protein